MYELEESISKGINSVVIQTASAGTPRVIFGNASQRVINRESNAASNLFQGTMEMPTYLIDEQRMCFVM